MQFSKKIDEYFLTFPKEIQEKLKTIRALIKNLKRPSVNKKLEKWIKKTAILTNKK